MNKFKNKKLYGADRFHAVNIHGSVGCPPPVKTGFFV